MTRLQNVFRQPVTSTAALGPKHSASPPLARRRRAGLLALVLAGLFAPGLLAQSPSNATPPPDEARLRIDNLEKLTSKAAEVVDVTLDQSMLQLAARFMSDERSKDEAQARELIKQLKGVYVKSFEFDKEGEYSLSDLESIRTQLHAPWSRIVDVRSKRQGENAEVYLMNSGADNKISGLAIIAAEPKELTVVNIVGPIDVDRLIELEGRLGVPRLDLERVSKPKKEAANHAPTK
ncbi:MAG TPA: DUF4252 domain-containing protein [Terriglobia bacterium]|nr:DUF4252 domain-containing protein [Terriglobia bacterium]